MVIKEKNIKQKMESKLMKLLLIPGFAVALIGAVPQYWDWMEAKFKGIDSSKIQIAKKSDQLFKRNVKCMATEKPKFYIKHKGSTVKFGPVVCPETNDVLVYIMIENKESKYQNGYGWIDMEEHVKVVSNSKGFLYAQQQLQYAPPNTGPRICSIKVIEGILFRVFKIKNKCYRQTVNTYTGRIIATIEVDCTKECTPRR